MLLRKLVIQVVASLLYYRRFHKNCFKIFPMHIMLALCLMLSETYYVQNYAGIIGLGLIVPQHSKHIKQSFDSLHDIIPIWCIITDYSHQS